MSDDVQKFIPSKRVKAHAPRKTIRERQVIGDKEVITSRCVLAGPLKPWARQAAEDDDDEMVREACRRWFENKRRR